MVKIARHQLIRKNVEEANIVARLAPGRPVAEIGDIVTFRRDLFPYRDQSAVHHDPGVDVEKQRV
ncbi:hypothetical protein [Bauldia litoralis]|uniref:hypothetical protein n=1 Tax=Bauldia litoralis TaxID=665467 RepID=UPI003262FB7F